MGACPFCDRQALEDRLILETENFAVIPTFGQVVEGYILIVPKRHTVCLGNLTEREMDEYCLLHERVRNGITSAYDTSPIAFEHGIVGQTVRHAHMHMAPPPSGVDLLSRIEADFPEFERISTFAGLQGIHQREGVYLLYENAQSEKYLFHIFSRPQYLRIVFAEEAGFPERGNWRDMDEMLDKELMLNTQRELRKKLR
jgi:ATP adenylyltransferase